MFIEWWMIVSLLVFSGLWAEYRHIRGYLIIYDSVQAYSLDILRKNMEPIILESYNKGYVAGVIALEEELEKSYNKT